MNSYIQHGNLQIAEVLYELVNRDILPGTGLEPDTFWQALQQAVTTFRPRNQALLEKRWQLQKQINAWHHEHAGQAHDAAAYKQFLYDIGYLQPEGERFAISTANVDDEIARIAGPQLVVPVTNARYALNATNARWGSLYDALYGSDVIGEEQGAERTPNFNPQRGARVVGWSMAFLDEAAPLAISSHASVSHYAVQDQQLLITLENGEQTSLKQAEQFAGYRGNPDNPELILLRNNNLHIELQIDREHPVRKTHPAGITDVVLEAALTTIQDLEDSVATVDAQDKVLAYRNWLGLMQGTLQDKFKKGEHTVHRTLQPDRDYLSPQGQAFTLPGRSLLLVRNVGLHMFTEAVLDEHDNHIPEGILDGLVTSTIFLHDFKRTGPWQNSRTGSMYIVKPKLHGPDEVAFTNELFDFIEDQLGLPRHTLKIGIMDEERRTSVNLRECIRAAQQRVVFINTGFLDRTGDEIHTSMEAGPVIRKAAMKDSTWIKAYEDRNVDIGLACGFMGKAQIGKGMWAMPDEMKQMLASKINHPLAGANTAWVPSPTAAVLHAVHYHQVNVQQQQQKLRQRQPASLDDLLTLPLLGNTTLDAASIEEELENNAQGILGYVVRWINQGVGCSKVPDIKHIGLMEDRATLRISSQHMANWLHHGLCSKQQVLDIMQRMAVHVDEQNAADPFYTPMAPDFDHSLAFQAACDLVFQGHQSPNGYTISVLNKYRRAFKLQHGL